MPEPEKLVEYRFAGRSDRLQEVRKRVRAALAPYRLAPTLVNAMVLAVDEACANIIRHAYGEGMAGEIVIEVLKNDQQVTFRLIDFARPVDRRRIQPRDLNDVRPGGLGLNFMRAVMDEIEYVDPPAGVGNMLQMRKRIAPR